MTELRAFTLMELLVGMIISSIVIAFGYGTYSLINKQYGSYKSVKTEIIMAAQLNSILGNDFVNAEMISFNENQLSIKKNNNLPLVYTFNDSTILRNENEQIDTFKIAPVAILADFVFREEKAVVAHFSFEAKVLNEMEYFTFNKGYSAETLMNYEIQFKNNR